MKNREHFARRRMESLLKSWKGYQNAYINMREGTKVSHIYEIVFSLLVCSLLFTKNTLFLLSLFGKHCSYFPKIIDLIWVS